MRGPRDRDGGKERRGKRTHEVPYKFLGCHFFGMFTMINSQWGKKPSYSLLSFLLATKDKKFSTSKFRNECKSAACSKSFPRQINGYK